MTNEEKSGIIKIGQAVISVLSRGSFRGKDVDAVMMLRDYFRRLIKEIQNEKPAELPKTD